MFGKYDLVLEWGSTVYCRGSVQLFGARFFGPALKLAARVSSNDAIRLDFTKQVAAEVGGWEICTLHWGEVVHQTAEEALLSGVRLEVDSLLVPKNFYPGDKILIDTYLHEEERHRFNLVYPAKIINTLQQPYFGSK